MPVPDSNFVASVPLQYVFLDKDTGAALASGVVTFYSDPEFSTKKSVYQLTLNPDNTITFDALPNPMILSGIGTFVDDTGNNVVPYYFPYTGTPGATDPGDLELYFVKVQSSSGVLQFTLNEWPPNMLSGSGGSGSSTSIETDNQITNPQFSVISFSPVPSTSIATVTVSGTTRTAIAPGWEVVTAGAGDLKVSQQTINEDIPTEATTAIRIETTGSITSVQLVQRLTDVPRLFSNPSTIETTSYISGYVVARSELSTSASVTMKYAPSNGVVTEVFSGSTLATHEFASISGTSAIDTPLSSDGPFGYVDIIIDISPLTQVDITSVQLLAVANDTIEPAFFQQSTQMQLSNLSWYYNPEWSFKPIKSYLVGWDFPLNPAQALGTSVAAQATGTNTGYYAWDQTILFQSADSAITTSRSTAGGLKLLAATTTQMAVMQYLSGFKAQSLLLQQLSVNVSALASASTTCTVSLWYTTSTLPSLPTTIITTLDASGYPSAVAAGWTEVPRIYPGNGVFSIAAGVTDFNNYPLSGWDLDSISTANSATYFAIVVGTSSMATNDYIIFNSISLVPGLIPTIPAPQTAEEVLADCQYYYQKSFLQGTTPAQNLGSNTGVSYYMQGVGATTLGYYPINFAVPLRATPSLPMSLYNPAAANGEIRNFITNTDYSGTTTATQTANGFIVVGTSPGGSSSSNLVGISWTADARLGIV